MNSDNNQLDDSLQLQQMIIFLKAELAKYQYEIKKYHNGYHYSLIEKLEQENEQLTHEKNELSEGLYRLNKELIKRTSDYKERIHLHEMQSKEYLTTIDALQVTKADLWTTNKQLTEVIQKLNVRFNTNQHKNRKHDKQVAALHHKFADNQITLEQLELKLGNLIQDAAKQLSAHIEKLDIVTQEKDQFKTINQLLLQEIAEKNKIIDQIQLERSHLKKQNDKLIAERNNNDDPPAIDPLSPTPLPSLDAKTLLQLDHQVKKLTAQSLDYESKLDAKLRGLHTLERELDQLNTEMNHIKVFSIGGKIIKEL